MARTALWRAGREVRTIFDLLGTDEDDLTAALGWALAQAPGFAAALGADVFGDHVGPPTDVYLQRRNRAAPDRTDVELVYGGAHCIIEAKRGWSMPRPVQLDGYAERLRHAPRPALVVLTEASDEYAAMHLPAAIDSVPVHHRRWRGLVTIARASRGREHRTLRDLIDYLERVTTMRDPESNRTYVVSLGRGSGAGGTTSFLDWVTRRSIYIHPYGPRWPREAPNYIGFRWNGALRQVRHVERYGLVDDLHDRFDEFPPGSGKHMVYDLGPVIGPAEPVPNGRAYRASRLWVALDLLLTSATVADAHAATKARLHVSA